MFRRFVTAFLSFTEELSSAWARGSMGTAEHPPCTPCRGAAAGCCCGLELQMQLPGAGAQQHRRTQQHTADIAPLTAPRPQHSTGPRSLVTCLARPQQGISSCQQRLNLCTCQTLENIPIQLSDVLKNSLITHLVTLSFSSKKARQLTLEVIFP